MDGGLTRVVNAVSVVLEGDLRDLLVRGSVLLLVLPARVAWR